MVRVTEARFDLNNFYGRIVIEYNPNNENDERIIHLIDNTILNEQSLCRNCEHYYRGGYFCGYSDCRCKIHGSLEEIGNSHYDGDGSKCNDYKRKNN